MLSIEALREYGADVDEGMHRCMDNEQFYFMLINKILDDSSIEKLEEAIGSENLEAAFEAAHGFKGVLGNLALTPVYKPVSEMTELLRSKEKADYGKYIEEIKIKWAKLKDMCGQ